MMGPSAVAVVLLIATRFWGFLLWRQLPYLATLSFPFPLGSHLWSPYSLQESGPSAGMDDEETWP